MTSPSSSLLSISPQPGQPPLSAQQKKFNALIRKIEAQRTLLGEWNLTIPVYRQKRAKDLAPLQAVYRAMNVEMAQFLDQAASQKGLSKNERDSLSDIVCELAASLIDDGPDGDAMKALYNKHSGGDFDEESAQEQREVKRRLKEQGVDLGDDIDLSSPEEVMQRLQQLRDAHTAQAADTPAAGQKKRKKSARQVALEAEQQQVGQSLREVYRKLASALHPDREPDPLERDRKTALMKRVNQAYAGKNLLDLLTLQLEVELIDPQGILTLGDDRLKRYNQILTEQLSELQNEIAGMAHAASFELGIELYEPLGPAGLLRELKSGVRMLQADISNLKVQRQGLVDLASLKRWLKQQRRQSEAFGNLDDLFDALRQER